MPRTERLPLRLLRPACREQRWLVAREWPDGIPLTKKAARRAAKLDLDLDWAAALLLRLSANERFLRQRQRLKEAFCKLSFFGTSAAARRRERAALNKYFVDVALLLTLLRVPRNRATSWT